MILVSTLEFKRLNCEEASWETPRDKVLVKALWRWFIPDSGRYISLVGVDSELKTLDGRVTENLVMRDGSTGSANHDGAGFFGGKVYGDFKNKPRCYPQQRLGNNASKENAFFEFLGK